MTSTPPPREAAETATTPQTVYPTHVRCGTSHEPNRCPLPFGADIGFPFKCSHAGKCALQCKEDFICDGDSRGRTTILMFADMGYCCRDCVLDLLKPYEVNMAKPIEDQLKELVEKAKPPPTVIAALERCVLDEEVAGAKLHIIKSGPGTCKTTLLALLSRL